MTYAEQVHEAVADEEWQKFRLSMKGKTTEDKLKMLAGYWASAPISARCLGDFSCVYCIRVDNYIKALCRGGQLYPGESVKTFVQNNYQLRIKS